MLRREPARTTVLGRCDADAATELVGDEVWIMPADFMRDCLCRRIGCAEQVRHALGAQHGQVGDRCLAVRLYERPEHLRLRQVHRAGQFGHRPAVLGIGAQQLRHLTCFGPQGSEPPMPWLCRPRRRSLGR